MVVIVLILLFAMYLILGQRFLSTPPTANFDTITTEDSAPAQPEPVLPYKEIDFSWLSHTNDFTGTSTAEIRFGIDWPDGLPTDQSYRLRATLTEDGDTLCGEPAELDWQPSNEMIMMSLGETAPCMSPTFQVQVLAEGEQSLAVISTPLVSVSEANLPVPPEEIEELLRQEAVLEGN
jgi:hypothetical protein